MSLRGEKGTAAGTGSGTARPEAEASTERPLPHVAGPSARRLSGTRSPCHDHQMALSLILCFLSLDCGSYEGGSLGSYQSLGNGTGREEQSGRVEEWGGDSDLLTEGTATPIPRKTDRKWRLQLKLPHLNGRSARADQGSAELSGIVPSLPTLKHQPPTHWLYLPPVTVRGSFWPQGLCTCAAHFLDCFSLTVYVTLNSQRPFLVSLSLHLNLGPRCFLSPRPFLRLQWYVPVCLPL